MQRLEVSDSVRPQYRSLGVKGLTKTPIINDSIQQGLPHRSAYADSSSYFTRTHPIWLTPRTYLLDPV